MEIYRFGFAWVEEVNGLDNAIVSAIGEEAAKEFVRNYVSKDIESFHSQDRGLIDVDRDWKDFLSNPYDFNEHISEIDVAEYFNDTSPKFFLNDTTDENSDYSSYQIFEFKKELFLQRLLKDYPQYANKEAIEQELLARKI